MTIFLRDRQANEYLYPFTAIRSAAHLRIGILTIKEKWERMTGARIMVESEVSEQHPLNANSVGSNFIPAADTTNISGEEPVASLKGHSINRPWEIFQLNDWAIREDFKLLTSGRLSLAIPDTVKCVSHENIFIEEGAKISYSILNATLGPIYIGKDAEIMEGSLIRGPAAICEGAVIKMGTKIYPATTIGKHCLAGGEIKNVIMQDFSNKAHDGYLGDSVIGQWCNLGAGTSNSNLKNTGGHVRVWVDSVGKLEDAGLKCGLLMGDYSRCAVNTTFNTGTVVGVSCNIFGNQLPPKYVPDFTWGTEIYRLEKVISDIGNWRKFKERDIEELEINNLKNLFQQKYK